MWWIQRAFWNASKTQGLHVSLEIQLSRMLSAISLRVNDQTHRCMWVREESAAGRQKRRRRADNWSPKGSKNEERDRLIKVQQYGSNFKSLGWLQVPRWTLHLPKRLKNYFNSQHCFKNNNSQACVPSGQFSTQFPNDSTWKLKSESFYDWRWRLQGYSWQYVPVSRT